jgi:hypothetical protein
MPDDYNKAMPCNPTTVYITSFPGDNKTSMSPKPAVHSLVGIKYLTTTKYQD